MNHFQTKQFFSYLFKARYWKGFGIHSPFVFDFVSKILYEHLEYYDFQKIHSWRKYLSKIKQKIDITDFGAGSTISVSKKRSVGEIVAQGSIPKRFGELLFRMINHFNPVGILELGASAGISTLYLALPKSSAKIITIEGCHEIATWANSGFEQFDLKNAELLVGTFSDFILKSLEKLPSLDFVFFDGDHRKKTTLAYFNECLQYINNDTVFVFDDIHWSQGMEQAWNEIVQCRKVTVSIDIFRFGIVFFRKECQKQHYIVRF